jgi:molecular chaperone DnaK
VHFAPDGSVTVGHAAAKRLTRDPANTFHSVKRFIGKRFKDKKVAEDARRVPYEVCATVEADAEAMGLVGLGPSKNGAGFVAVRCPALGRKVSPEEISAAIVKRCVALASAKLGGELITKAVITVPAYFDDGQCDATIRAGLRAGLETVKLLREPIAAALAYGVDVTGDETVFVFDLGGGTFDVSVLDVGGGAVEVLATGGDAHLGGDDLDRAVAVWLAKEAKLMGATVDPRGALQAARRAREKLSDATEVVVPMPGGSTKTLTRPLLEKVCSEILRDLRLPVENAADSAGINLEALQAESRSKKSSKKSRKTGRPFDHVLLVGGATKTPAVRRFVENTFGRRPTPGLVDPDEVVALGAAAHAGALEGLVAQTETLGPMQASLIRAFARKMRNEDESLFERVRDDAEGVERGGAFDASGMAATAAAAGMDLVEEEDDDWGPEDLSELEGLTDEEIEALIAEMGDEEDEDEDEDENERA